MREKYISSSARPSEFGGSGGHCSEPMVDFAVSDVVLRNWLW